VAARHALASRHAANIVVLTWNVWFDTRMEFDLRLKSLVSQVLAASPCVAGLQEVTPRFAAAVRTSHKLTSLYAVSPNEITSYGCLLLVRRDFPVSWQEQPLPSNMGRTLLVAECAALARRPAFTVGTVHLESLNSPSKRREQLAVCRRMLQGRPAACLCGDFNFDSRRAWGDWLRPVPTPDCDLENHVLSRELPGYVDCWPALHPGGEPGYTFDGQTNSLCIADAKEQMRYDRILTSGAFTPRLIEIIGLEDIQAEGEGAAGAPGLKGLKASDHYGLVCALELQASVPTTREKTAAFLQSLMLRFFGGAPN